MARGPLVDYTPELAEKICDIIACNPYPLRVLCTRYHEIPNPAVIYKWTRLDPVFNEMYLDAKRHQAFILIDDLVELCDDESNLEADYLNWSKFRCETRKWLAKRLLPKVYGDRQQLEELAIENNAIKTELRELQEKLNAEHKKDY